MEFTVAPELAPEVLAKRTSLPLKPAPVSLRGSVVRLEPLDLKRDVQALFAVSNGRPCVFGGRRVEAYDADALVWRYMSGGPFAGADDLARFLRPQVEAATGLCLRVVDAGSDARVGVANFMNNAPEHLKIELGNIWYSPLVQRTMVNTEATALMLEHAFGLGYRRVEWKCDALNERSRRAALRMGFSFEGIHDKHFIVKGRSRDTAWFRILDDEWPDAHRRLDALLSSPTR